MTEQPKPKPTHDDVADLADGQIIIGLLVQVMHQMNEVKAKLDRIETTLKYHSGGTAWERGWQRLEGTTWKAGGKQ
jgi:hypothetical protein